LSQFLSNVIVDPLKMIMKSNPVPDKQIQIEQIKQLFQRLPLSLIITFLVALIISFVQTELIIPTNIYIWLVITILITSFRFIQWLLFKRATITDSNIQKWSNLFLICTICAGSAWGITPFILFPENNIQHQFYLILVIGGISAAGMTSLSSRYINVIFFLLLALIPLITKLVFVGTVDALITGFFLLMYLAGLMILSKRTYNMIHESLILKHENISKDAQLYATEERYHSLVENLPIGIYRVSSGKESQIEMANSTILRIFGYENLDELKKIPVSKFFVDPEKYNAFTKDLLNADKAIVKEFKVRKKNEEEFWCLITSKTEKGPHGKIDHFDGIVEDITLRHTIIRNFENKRFIIPFPRRKYYQVQHQVTPQIAQHGY